MSTNALTLLTELRQRLLWIAATWLLFFLLSWHFDERLLMLITNPLLQYLHTDHFIATSAFTPLMTLLSVSAYSATAASIPVMIWHLTRFLMPALYPQERKRLLYSLIVSLILVFLGIGFAFFVVFPMLFDFLYQLTPSAITLLPEAHQSLLTMIKMLLGFALIFQTPLIVFFLLEFQWIEAKTIQRLRPHIILACFTLGMLLTPPDVLSQILLAIPLWLLIELGLAAFTICHKKTS